MVNSDIETIIKTSLGKLYQTCPNIALNVAKNDYFVTTVKVNNKLYTMVDFDTKLNNLTKEYFLEYSRSLFNDWRLFEKNYKDDYKC